MPIRVKSSRPAATAPRRPDAPVFGLPLPPPGWVQKPAGVSLCMIVKNEERFLEKCLASVADAVDEINIVDTGSTDRTVEIAQKFGARIEHHEWRNDFAWARNKSIEMATKRWIFQLDADEEVLPESITALKQLATAPAHLVGVWIRCVNGSNRYHGGGVISHAIVRIFPNDDRIRFHGAIHEFPSLDGSPMSLPAANSPIRIVHYGYLEEVVKERGKYERNMAIVEADVEREPEEAFHWYNYGMTAHLGGDHDRGVIGLTRMWELCQKNGMRAFTANGLQTLADIYSERKNQPEIGLEYALECLKWAPRYANAHFSTGKAYFGLERYEEAREMYSKAIDDGKHLDKQFVVDDEVPVWKAQCEIGSTYVAQGDNEKALEWFEKGLANRPNVRPLRENYAFALERVGRLSEAEQTFRDLYAEFDDEQGTLHLVNYLLRRQKEREAVTIIERRYGDMAKPTAVSMLMAAAAVAERFGWPNVEHYVNLADAVDPQAPEVIAARSRIERSKGDAAVAAQRLKELFAAQRMEETREGARDALQRYPGDARIAYFGALACANLQRKDDALAFLEAVPLQEFGDAPAMLKAVLLREKGRDADALRAAEHAAAQNPFNVDAALLRAALLEPLGRLEEAERTLRDASSRGGQRVAVELAGFYLRAGRVEDAKRVANQALA
jgi:tetratricopeptide (TPR) repeat protein